MVAAPPEEAPVPAVQRAGGDQYGEAHEMVTDKGFVVDQHNAETRDKRAHMSLGTY
eukprot:CAMPEP_0173108336 /NCGR_PEP_ID=MMETSP1102-20130122/42605_1 /TAXON_ID=49646 /ORGANISM="Geminigera sp., Strain Caron Lab Isolate" /LENGTH=55 /DNA_ID=CAMNT_0014006683 /DNA_START=223 /DNA_END=387 /DNA_ORIENTATION=-